MHNARLDLLNDYPFQRLNELLAGTSPRANLPPIVMSVGEPQHQPPAFVREIIDRGNTTWNRYPPLNGSPEFRAACAAWLTRRYKLRPGSLDADTQIAPVAGTREGLFQAALLAITPRDGNGAMPLALMPNPFYQVYYGAAVMAGAECAFLPAKRETGFLPDLDALDEATLSRAAIFYLCSPANPQGAVADLAYLKGAGAGAAVRLPARVRRVLWRALRRRAAAGRPRGGGRTRRRAVEPDRLPDAVEALQRAGPALRLRGGIARDDPRFNRLRAFSCAATPTAVLDAATALWRDEEHVEANRALYRAKYDLADKLLAGRFGYYRPAGGFYLWLDVVDGEAATKRLWSEAGIKVLPGGYVTRPDAQGRNIGKPYIRVALVHDLETTEAALTRMASVLKSVA